MPTETRTVPFDGRTVSGRVFGRGEPGTPLLLLHGAGGNALHWPPRLRRLPGRAVHALDWPGHGASSGPPLAHVEEFAQLARAWLDAAGVAQAVVMGHSLGSAAALAFALAWPERTAGLVVVSGGAQLPVSADLLRLLDEDFDAATARLAEWSYARGTSAATLERHRAQLRRTGQATLRAAFQACAAFDAAPQLAASPPAVPALVLVGDEDRMTRPARAAALHAALPRSRFHSLAQAGHTLPLEQPDALTTLTADFLSHPGETRAETDEKTDEKTDAGTDEECRDPIDRRNSAGR